MEKLTLISTGQRHRYGGKETIMHNEDRSIWVGFGFSWVGNNDGGYFAKNYGGTIVAHLHIEVNEERFIIIDEHLKAKDSNDAQKVGSKFVREIIRPIIKKAFNVKRK